MLVEAIRSPEVVQMSQSYGKTHNRNIESSNRLNAPALQAEKVPLNILETGKAVQAPATVSETVIAKTAVPDRDSETSRYLKAEQLLRSAERLAADDRDKADNPVAQEALNRHVEEATRSFFDNANEDRNVFLDEATGRLGMRVIDKQTGEVLRQIPPEELLTMIARLKESIGAFIDHQS
jgi:flagellar protein FlaG